MNTLVIVYLCLALAYMAVEGFGLARAIHTKEPGAGAKMRASAEQIMSGEDVPPVIGGLILALVTVVLLFMVGAGWPYFVVRRLNKWGKK